jgi:hypothetical protein
MRERRRKRPVDMPRYHMKVHIFSNNSGSMTGPDGDMTISALSTFMCRVNSPTGS